MKWTIEDMMAGECDITQVGSEKEEPVVGETLGTIEDYLAIHKELGGRPFLLAWARANPAKFYDQLLKILEKMGSVEKAGEGERTLAQLSVKDLESMSSVEIKRLLVGSGEK